MPTVRKCFQKAYNQKYQLLQELKGIELGIQNRKSHIMIAFPIQIQVTQYFHKRHSLNSRWTMKELLQNREHDKWLGSLSSLMTYSVRHLLFCHVRVVASMI